MYVIVILLVNNYKEKEWDEMKKIFIVLKKFHKIHTAFKDKVV
jgi:hypothetical protein